MLLTHLILHDGIKFNFLEIASTTIPVLISILAIIISISNSKMQVRLNLFSKRHKAYEAIKGVLVFSDVFNKDNHDIATYDIDSLINILIAALNGSKSVSANRNISKEALSSCEQEVYDLIRQIDEAKYLFRGKICKKIERLYQITLIVSQHLYRLHFDNIKLTDRTQAINYINGDIDIFIIECNVFEEETLIKIQSKLWL